jgi:hypothetical protein
VAAGVEGLGPQLSRRMPMFDRPAPPAADERAAAADPLPDPGTIDAAQMVAGGLNDDPHGAVTGAGAGAGAGPIPAGSAARGGEGPAGSHDGRGATAPAGRLTSGTEGAGVSGRPGGSAAPGVSAPAGSPGAPAPTATGRAERERLPGMAPIWQLENGSRPTHVLGPGSPAEPTPASEPTSEAFPATPEAALPPEAPHPLGPVDPPQDPDAGER